MDEGMDRRLRRLALVAAVGMLLVLVMGATVTSTGSGEGCGQSWPMCQGRVFPPLESEPIIEWSHRLVTGIEGFLLLGVAIGGWLARRRFPAVRLLIPLMIGALLLQSGMGAWAVRSPQSSTVMAFHFGISLIALASVYLTMRVLSGAPLSDDREVPLAFRRMAWAALIGCYLVAYLGAYVRHTGSELGCGTSWPLCNGGLAVEFSGAEGIHAGHRLASLVAVGLVLLLVRTGSALRGTRPDLYRASLAALILIVIQALVGGVVVLSTVSLASTLAHAAVMGLLFLALCENCRGGLPWARRAPAHRAVSPEATAATR
jgi:cytochrome c oxidase assembly protein subunit 15